MMQQPNYTTRQDHEKLSQISSRISNYQQRAERLMLAEFPELDEAMRVANRDSRERLERDQPTNPLTTLTTN